MKDQYLKALEIFDADNTRFWTRFNVSIGLQLIMAVGLASNYKALIGNIFFGCLTILVALAFSIFTVLVMWRSLQINIGMFNALQDLEDKDQSLILLKTYSKHSQSPNGIMARYCLGMSSLLTLFWFVILYVSIMS